MEGERLAGVEAWLVDFGLTGDDQGRLVQGFAQQLLDAGLGLCRLSVGTDVLHPTVGGRGFRWVRGLGLVKEEFDRDVTAADDNPNWVVSPWYRLIKTGERELRRRVGQDHVTGEFPLVDRLFAEGSTDYVAFAVPYGRSGSFGGIDGLVASLSVDADGFTSAQLEALRRLLPRFALAYKAIGAELTARTLLETYLGRDAANRVLAGSIGRGAAEMIRAAIWYSDLEGFTRLADTLPREQLMPFLNAYAELFVEAIHGHGGQVLKFMGDGILAIFPLEGPSATGCDDALAAALAAQRASAKLFAERTRDGHPVSRCFIGLHTGELLYGNVGSADRLDFTVLGPAVNETARLERLCRSLEQPVIVSESFAAACSVQNSPLVGIGRYALRGVGRAQMLHAIDPELLGEWA